MRLLAPLCSALLILACAGLVSCKTGKRALLDLEEVHGAQRDPDTGYATHITQRGWLWGPKQELYKMLGRDPPEAGVREVDDPLGFSLDRLADLREVEPKDLTAHEWVRSLGVLEEIVALDPARIVRADALRTLGILCEPLLVHRSEPFAFELVPFDEAEVTAKLQPLIDLAAGAKVTGDLTQAVETLLVLRPEDALLAAKLVKVGATAGEKLEGTPAADPVLAATQELSLHTAYLVASRSLVDPGLEVRSAALALILRLDPVTASTDLAAHYVRLFDVTVKVALLKALLVTEVDPRKLDAALRRELLLELDAPDIAVKVWAHRALAKLLGMHHRKHDVDRVRAAWQDLGDWQPVEGDQ